MKLKVHDKAFNQFTEIDKFILLPKKAWDDLGIGEQEISLNQKRLKVRVYDVPCDCTGEMHSHRLVDLRSVWGKLGVTGGQDVELTK